MLALGALIITYIIGGFLQEQLEAWNSRIIDRLFDLRTRVNPVQEHSADVVVHIDANLYFSRPQHARIIGNLADMGVSVQVIDFLLPERISKADDQPLIDATRNAGNVFYGFSFDRLDKTAESKSVRSPDIRGQGLDSSRWSIPHAGDLDDLWLGVNPRLSHDALSRASKGIGFLNLTPDPDGIIRRLPLLVRYQDAVYPSVSLRALCDYLKVGSQQVVVSPSKSITLKNAQLPDESVLQDVVIPIDRYGRMILNVTPSWQSILHYSYSKIFQTPDNQSELAHLKEALAGKIAIISESVETEYRIRTADRQKRLSSGLIQALVLQNMLAGTFLRELPQYAGVLIEIGLLVLLILLSMRYSSPALSLGTIALTAGYLGLAAIFFSYGGFIFQFVQPVMLIGLALAFLLVGMGIEKALLFARTERAKRLAEQELEIGRQIQSGFFPTSLPAPPGWELATHFQAARHVAGDFYDVFTLGNDKKVGLVIADVCDKGVGAALFMALFRSFIRVLSGTAHSDGHLALTNPATDPAKILQKTILAINNYISITHEQAGMFATIFYAILDPKNGRLTYINGGHEPPVIVGAEGIKANLNPTGPAVGLYPDLEFKTRTVQLERNDILLIYTDGATDARNRAGEAFTKERLQGLFRDNSLPAEELIKKIQIQLNDHIFNENQFDDITLMALRRKG
jgi:serine phosphatase RsbU (regulator of sigma subunit)/CHASE2 domain-containing sensor protein